MTEIAELDVFWATDAAGRDHNEDTYVVLDESDTGEAGVLVAVFDGMGGAAAGEWASTFAADTVHNRYGNLRAGGLDPHDALGAALSEASNAIRDAVRQDPTREGMGSTVVALAIEDGHCRYAHVGDSRLYAYDADRGLRQLTRDHSKVQGLVDQGLLRPEDADGHPAANVITRALGRESDEVDLNGRVVEELAHTTFMLCSDGLVGPVTPAIIERALRELSAADAVASLIEVAKRGGTSDNVTVAVVRAEGREHRSADGFVAWALGELGASPAEASSDRDARAPVASTKASAEPSEQTSRFGLIAALVAAIVIGVFVGSALRGDSGEAEPAPPDTSVVEDAAAPEPEPHIPIPPIGRPVEEAEKPEGSGTDDGLPSEYRGGAQRTDTQPQREPAEAPAAPRPPEDAPGPEDADSSISEEAGPAPAEAAPSDGPANTGAAESDSTEGETGEQAVPAGSGDGDE